MKGIIKILFSFSFLLFFTNVTFGQLVSDAYCKEFENAVATPFKPTHWYHNIVFTDECWLEFDIDKKGGIGISFKLEKTQTEKAARKCLYSDIEMYKTAKYNVTKEGETIFIENKHQKINKNVFWDEAYAYENNYPMLLRRKRTFITVFCDKKELCLQIEEKLREVSVLREF